MKKIIALAVVAALFLGTTSSAQAVEFKRQPASVTAGKKAPQPPRRPQAQHSSRPQAQPSRPQQPQTNHRPSAPQQNHRPSRPQQNHKPAPSRPAHNSSSSTASKIGLGVLLGAIVGTAIVHATR